MTEPGRSRPSVLTKRPNKGKPGNRRSPGRRQRGRAGKRRDEVVYGLLVTSELRTQVRAQPSSLPEESVTARTSAQAPPSGIHTAQHHKGLRAEVEATTQRKWLELVTGAQLGQSFAKTKKNINVCHGTQAGLRASEQYFGTFRIQNDLAQGFPGSSVAEKALVIEQTQVRPLAQEDPTCHGAAGSGSGDHGAHALESAHHSRSHRSKKAVHHSGRVAPTCPKWKRARGAARTQPSHK